MKPACENCGMPVKFFGPYLRHDYPGWANMTICDPQLVRDVLGGSLRAKSSAMTLW